MVFRKIISPKIDIPLRRGIALLNLPLKGDGLPTMGTKPIYWLDRLPTIGAEFFVIQRAIYNSTVMNMKLIIETTV